MSDVETPLNVEFPSEGITLRGHLYLPEGPGPHPVVVMAGGWCYVKELVQPDYARVFVAAGVAALVFDYRTMGDSDGEPRQHLDPWQQIEDYKNAISYAETRPELDSKRIGIWGISYSGGHVLIVGATDSRVKCIVSNIPVIDGHKTMRLVHGAIRFRELSELILDDRRNRLATGKFGYLPMSTATPADELTTWPFPEVTSAFTMLKETEAPNHDHRNTIASVEMLLNYDPSGFAPRILNTPTLMTVAERDDITMWDDEIRVFNAIGTAKKRLFVFDETSHMTLYSNKSRLEIAAEQGRSWLVEHLVTPFT
ncbi:MAG: alpha/beta fold hydrolase [Ilumatobacteraceae bacterium]